jgi:hypothetical protein
MIDRYGYAPFTQGERKQLHDFLQENPDAEEGDLKNFVCDSLVFSDPELNRTYEES